MRALIFTVLAVALASCSSGDPAPAPAPTTAAVSSATPAPAPTAPWAEGQCVNVSFSPGPPPVQGDATQAVPCDVPLAFGKITDLVDDGALGCPASTDGVLKAPTGEAVCVRNLRAPHPSDPGKGGGLLRPGDCILTVSDDPVERPCYDSRGPGKIKRFLKKKSDCHAADGFYDGHYTTTRKHPTLPVICHGEGDSVETPAPQYPTGTCVQKPRAFTNETFGTTNTLALRTTPCTASSAWAEVTATTSGRCPRSTTHTVTSTTHYPPKTCLRRR